MKKLIILLLTSVWAVVVQSASSDELLKPRYTALDRELQRSEAYDRRKESRIDSLRTLFLSARRLSKAHELAMLLADEYRSFTNDSAIHYAKRGIELADRMGNRHLREDDRVVLINQYIYSSNYREAEYELQNLSAADVTSAGRIRYYTALCHINEYMGNDAQGDERTAYHRLATIYRDSLRQLVARDSDLYYREQCSQLCLEGRYDEAREACNAWRERVGEYSRDYAVATYYSAVVAEAQGLEQERRHWLVESSISDIRNSVKHQMSLWTLASILASEGDLNRSYQYIEQSWNCAQRFNARVLTWMISPVFTSINESYNERLRSANSKLFLLAIAVSLLALGLGFSYVLVRRKGKQLAIARANLAATNSQLEEFNTRLSHSNTELAEANRLKEEYIGQFFSICSEYIEKLDKYRIKVNRKLKAGQTAELLKMTASEQLHEDEQKELLANFDRIFINIFPNFIERFNALVEPDSRIQPNHGQRLTTTLRIFALIRLGIEESSRIAEFLNYPPGTIYNYRNRIKTHALCDRAEFEERVKSIGMD